MRMPRRKYQCLFVQATSVQCRGFTKVTEIYRRWCVTAVQKNCGSIGAVPMRNEKESGEFTGLFKETENVQGSSR